MTLRREGRFRADLAIAENGRNSLRTIRFPFIFFAFEVSV